MKTILIIANTSYIARSFATYAKERFTIRTLSSRAQWTAADFSGCQSVLFCAGIAHKNQAAVGRDLYFQVNCDLALEAARQAKAAGAGQFLYLSSMSVYGRTTGTITRDTLPQPRQDDWYGSSKYQAEQQLSALRDAHFRIAILRPPMVYGPGCPGNFPQLVRAVRKAPLFPDIKNRRSAIYIDTLAEFLANLIETGSEGVFHPQNRDYVNTSELARAIAAANGKKLPLTKAFNPLIRALLPHMPKLQKLFGDLIYAKDIDPPTTFPYQSEDWELSVQASCRPKPSPLP